MQGLLPSAAVIIMHSADHKLDRPSASAMRHRSMFRADMVRIHVCINVRCSATSKDLVVLAVTATKPHLKDKAHGKKNLSCQQTN